MTGPAHRDLQRVVASLAAHLAEQVDGMLTDDRFAAGREALERLADADHARDLDALDPLEAAWLADELRRRWGSIGDVLLDPFAWVDGPEVRDGEGDGDGEEAVRLTVGVDGLDPGWTVAWSGATPDEDDAATATWAPPTVEPGGASPEGPDETGTSHPAVTARVMGRGPNGRVILTAFWSPPRPPEEE